MSGRQAIAVKRLNEFANKVSKNNSRQCFILKCDIKKFFDSIDQEILMRLIKREVSDENALWLLEAIIKSFKKGIPLGNVTSQIFANIYLNELDQFIKRTLKIKYYIRYCDDFVILSDDEYYLRGIISRLDNFLQRHLKLKLHPDKIILKKYHQGMDFLGYVDFPYHKILRIKTKSRIFKKLDLKIDGLKQDKVSEKSFNQTLWSYFGILKHCDSCRLGQKIIELLLDKLGIDMGV